MSPTKPDPAPTLNEAKNARERLKPLRRLLDDIDTAVDYALSQERETDARKGQIVGLRQEIEGLQKERDALDAEVKKTGEAHAQRVKEQQAAYDRERDEQKRVLAALQETVSRETELWAERQAQLEAEHKEQVTKYRATIKDLEDQVGKLTVMMDKLRRDVAPLLR